MIFKGQDLKKTILLEIISIIEEGNNKTPYDLIDFMIGIMTKNQLNEVEDMITNHYPKN